MARTNYDEIPTFRSVTVAPPDQNPGSMGSLPIAELIRLSGGLGGNKPGPYVPGTPTGPFGQPLSPEAQNYLNAQQPRTTAPKSTTSKIIDTASGVSSVIGGIQAGRQRGREAEALATQRQDQNALNNAQFTENTNVNAIQNELAQRRYQDAARSQNQRESLFGGWLQGAHSLSLPSGINAPQLSGGPDAIVGKSQIGSDLQRAATERLLHPDPMRPIAPTPAPPLTPLPKGGKLDTALNIIGMVGGGLGAYNQAAGAPATDQGPAPVAPVTPVHPPPEMMAMAPTGQTGGAPLDLMSMIGQNLGNQASPPSRVSYQPLNPIGLDPRYLKPNPGWA